MSAAAAGANIFWKNGRQSYTYAALYLLYPIIYLPCSRLSLGTEHIVYMRSLLNQPTYEYTLSQDIK